MNWTIKPAELLAQMGLRFRRRGNWLTVNICPFCKGGKSKDIQTFIVHAADGNYSCSRSKCGEKGSFWGLIERANLNPRDYFEKEKKKNFIYGK